MKTSSILWLALSLLGCAKPTVRCDARLEAINGPRPHAAAIASPEPDRAPAPALAGTQP
jgi:hypothetical protein